MGLKETIAAGIWKGFLATSNVREAVTFKAQTVDPSYSVTAGSVTRTEQDYPLLAVMDAFAVQDIDGQQIKPQDVQCRFPQAALPVRPTLLDRVVRANGHPHHIVAIKEDAASATWWLQLRTQ